MVKAKRRKTLLQAAILETLEPRLFLDGSLVRISTLYGTGDQVDPNGQNLHWKLVAPQFPSQTEVRLPAGIEPSSLVQNAIFNLQTIQGLPSAVAEEFGDGGSDWISSSYQSSLSAYYSVAGKYYGQAFPPNNQETVYVPELTEFEPVYSPASDNYVPLGNKTVFDWQTLFDLSDYNASTANLTLQLAAFGSDADIYLNGKFVQSESLSSDSGFGNYLSINIASGFLPGENTLDIEIDDSSNLSYAYDRYDYKSLDDNSNPPPDEVPTFGYVFMITYNIAVPYSGISAQLSGTAQAITADNPGPLENAPVVTVSEPSNLSNFLHTPIVLSAAASGPDNQSNIQSVVFYDGDTAIGSGVLEGGSSTDGTWLLNWTPTTTGTHDIHAVATNALELSTTSDPIDINVTVPSNQVFDYFNDFEDPSAIGPEWSTNTTEATPIGDRHFLGEFGWEPNTGNDVVTLNLNQLPQHDTITISFDLYMLRTWGGNAIDPDHDVWDAAVVGGQTLIRSTFSNGIGDMQSYPDPAYTGNYTAFTGSVEQGTLGYYVNNVDMDSVYHLTFTFPSTSASIAFKFFSENYENLGNESWGLDNVHVTASWHSNDDPPVVAVDPPSSGQQTISPNTLITLRAYASDPDPNDSVAKVIFYDNGTPIGLGTLTDPASGLWTLNWSTPDWGDHSISAEAITASGETTRTSNSESIHIPDPNYGSAISFTVPQPVPLGDVVNMSVLLGDPSQDTGNLTYYWLPITWPDSNSTWDYPQLDWSINGTSAAKNISGTLPAPGDYEFTVTVFNGHQSSFGDVTVYLGPSTSDDPPAVAITDPGSSNLAVAGSEVPLIAAASDPDVGDEVNSVEFFDNGISIGNAESYIDSTGTFWLLNWFPQTDGNHTITAVATSSPVEYSQYSLSTTSAPLTLDVQPAGTPVPPRLDQPPAAEFTTTTGCDDLLSILSNNEEEDTEPNLTYTWHWTLDGNPSSTVVFSDNGTNSAGATSVQFSAAGTYSFWVVATNSDGLSTTSSAVTVTVIPAFSTASINSPTSSLSPGDNFQFSMSNVVDQFGNTYDPSNWAVTWSSADAGSITSDGLYTAADAPGDYLVTADFFDKLTNSHFFGTAAVTVAAAVPPVAIDMPTDVQGASYPQAIQLTWDDDTSDSHAGWNVYRLDPQSGNYTKLNSSLITDTLGFNDESAPVQQTSTYEVTEVNTQGVESDPVQISVYRALHGDPPAPASLTGGPHGTGSIELTWPAVNPVEDLGHTGDALAGYDVYRWNSAQQSYQLLTASPITSTSFIDTGLANLTSYSYVVRAVDGDGDPSPNSTPVTIETDNGATPSVPTNLTALSSSSTSSDQTVYSINLTWSPSTGSPAATGYVIYRSTSSSGNFTQIASLNASTTSYDDSSLDSQTTYYYQVCAIDANSDQSAPTIANAVTPPSGPVAPYISITSPTSIQLVTDSLDVRGIVDDLNNDLTSWTLALDPLSDTTSAYIVIAEGSSQEGSYDPQDASASQDTLLGTIQAMLIRDGMYQLVLNASDAAGNQATECIGPQIQIQSDQKIGDFTFSVTDASIPANGGSVDITRTYDSLNRSLDGTLGYGWQLNIDAQIQEASNIRTNYTVSSADESGVSSVSIRSDGDRDVYVTLPTGQRVKFDFSPSSEDDIPENGNEIQAQFTPDGLSYGATLSLLPGEQMINEGTDIISNVTSPHWMDDEFNDGEPGVAITDFTGDVDYLDMEDIKGYILTTANGTQYYFEKQESAVTADYGSLQVNVNNSDTDTDTPVEVDHLYDGPPVLTKIVDVHGNETDISTLPNGDTLLTIIPNYIYEGEGAQYAKITRDSQGRATAIYTNTGEDGSGGDEVAEYFYDDFGNLTFVNQKTLDNDGSGNAVWTTTKYGYTDENPVVDHAMSEMFSPANVDRNLTADFTEVLSNTYNLQNGVLESTTTYNGSGAGQTRQTTHFSTDLVSRMEAVQDANGQTTLYQYDNFGNILFETSPTGLVTAYTYFPNTHNVQSQTDDYGTRDGNGVVTVNSDSVTHYYTYDSQNAQTSDTYTFNGVTTTTSTAYIDVNNMHLVWYTVAANGLTTRNSYDAQGNLTETDIFESSGQVGEQYTFNNMLQKTTYDAYDTRGNLLSTTIWNKDANGWYRYSKTVNEYDVNNGQIISTRVYGFTAREYDWATYDDTVYPNYPFNGNDLILLQVTTMGYSSAGDLTVINQGVKAADGSWTLEQMNSNQYDDQHRIIETDGPTGDTKTFYTPSGQVDYTINNRGNVTKYIYNDLGQVTDTLTAASLDDLNAGNYTQTSQTYDADGRVLTSTDALGNTTFNIYDAAGNLIDSLTTNSTESRTVYNAAGLAEWTTATYSSNSTITDLNNTLSSRATLTTYDALGRMVSTQRYAGVGVVITGVVLPSGNTGYQSSLAASGAIIPGDANHDGVVDIRDLQIVANHWQQTDPANSNGSPLTDAQMDAFGDVNHNGIVDIFDLQIVANNWQQVSTTNQLLFTLSATQYDAYGRVASTTDAAGQTTSYQYDAMGRQIAVTQPAVNVFNPTTGSNDLVHPTTHYEYDALGRQTAVEAPWIWTRNASGSWVKTRLRTETQYNELGEAVAVLTEQVLVNADGSDGALTVLSTTSTAYDSLGRKTSSTDALGQTTTYVYDEASNLTDVYLPAVPDPTNGNTMTSPHYQYGYDQYGDQTSSTDPYNNTTYYTYDAFGRQTSRTLPALTGQSAATAYTTYDAYGRTLTQTDFDGNITSYIYSDTLSPSDPNYSKTGRLVFEKFYANETNYQADAVQGEYAFTYDPLGRLASISDPSGSTSYTYDTENRLASVTQSINLPAPDVDGDTQYTSTITYGYNDSTGQLTRITSNANDTLYNYDALGRLQSVIALKLNNKTWGTLQSNGSISGVKLETDYTYDAVGNLVSVSMPLGDQMSYQYNSQDQLLAESISDHNGNLEQTYNYTLDADGDRTSDLEVAYSGGAPLSADLVTWTYDNDERLTSETRDGIYTSSLSGNLSISGLEYSDVYTLDLSGNRLMQVHTDGNASLDNTITDTYDSRDELTAEASSLNGNTTYTYDNNGSTTGKLQIQNLTTVTNITYTYDATTHLTLVHDNLNPSVADTAYSYDSNGNLVTKYNTTTDVGTIYITDSNNPTGYSQTIEEHPFNLDPDSGDWNITLKTSYLLGSSVLAQESGATLSFLMTDGHGNTRILTTYSIRGTTLTYASMQRYTFDAFGNFYKWQTYDANGNTTTNASAPGTTHLLFDMTYDASSGQQLDRARIYEPDEDRFMTADDQGYGDNTDPITLHLYLFANGNPINFQDPSGHVSLWTGTAVHTYLCSYQFESLGIGATPGSLRFGNKWVSTIIASVTGKFCIPIPLRPDMVEVYGVAPCEVGDVYELKPGPIKLITNPSLLYATALDSINQMLSYVFLLSKAPSVSWDAGASLWTGVKDWPGFAGGPPGSILVTFADYSLAPGIIFYDFLPSPKAMKIAGLSIAAASAIVASWYLAPALGTAIGTITALAVEEVQTILAAVGLRSVATGTPI